MYLVYYTGMGARQDYLHTTKQIRDIARGFGFGDDEHSLRDIVNELGAILYRVRCTEQGGIRIARV